MDTQNSPHTLKHRDEQEIRQDIKQDLYRVRREIDELILHLIELYAPCDHER